MENYCRQESGWLSTEDGEPIDWEMTGVLAPPATLPVRGGERRDQDEVTTNRGGLYRVVRSPGFVDSGRRACGAAASRQLGRLRWTASARRYWPGVPWIGATRPGRPDNYRTVLVPSVNAGIEMSHFR